MFNPAELFIGLRYIRAKRRNSFISFISLVSMIGIALGVMVLITVLSVMNGFDKEIKNRVFTLVSPVTVGSVTGFVANWQDLQKELKTYPEVTASAPYVAAEVLLNYGGVVQPALLSGVIPEEEKNITELSNKMVSGKLADLKQGEFGIILGQDLAAALGASIGDKITVVTPQISLSPAGVTPRFKRFVLLGLFKAGSGFGFDRSLAFINLTDSQKLLGLENNVTGLHVSMKNVFAAPMLANQMMQELSPTATVTTWADQFGEFFHAIQLEKTMMFLILMLIVAVAAFNLVSTLVMVVSEKQADIAILRTYGATPGMIMRIFMVQGGMSGILGTLIGVIAGVVLSYNVTALVNWIEAVFHVQFLSSNVYFVNYLPSEIMWSDVLTTTIASLALSLVATIYPAWRAARMDPVESLRYE